MPIRIGAGLLDEIGPSVRAVLAGGPPTAVAAVVTDSTVAGLYLERVVASLRRADYAVVEIQIPEGEAHKNLAWLALAYDRLIDAGSSAARRSSRSAAASSAISRASPRRRTCAACR